VILQNNNLFLVMVNSGTACSTIGLFIDDSTSVEQKEGKFTNDFGGEL